MAVIHFFDPATRRPLRTTLEVDSDSSDIQQVWRTAKLPSPVTGTLLEPPPVDCIFDGDGWIPLSSLTPGLAATLLCFAKVPYEAIESAVDLNTAVDSLRSSIHLAMRKVGHRVEDKYTRSERETWPDQLREVEDYQQDKPTPMLSAIAEIEGREVSELAETILRKQEAYRQLKTKYIVLTNFVRKRQRELDASNPEERISGYVELINYLANHELNRQ